MEKAVIYFVEKGSQNGGVRNRRVGVGSVKSLEFGSVRSEENSRKSDELVEEAKRRK